LFCLVSLPLACLEFVFASFSLRFASFRIFLFEAKKGHPTLARALLFECEKFLINNILMSL
jgi:hypothetical protein